MRHRRVVDEDVQPAECIDCLPYHRLHLRVVRHVGADEQRPGALSFDQAHCLLRVVLGPRVVDNDIRAALRQVDGGRAPDAYGRTRNDRCFAPDIHRSLQSAIHRCFATILPAVAFWG